MKKTKLATEPDDFDLMLVFTGIKLFVLTDPEMYSDEETLKIDEIVKMLSDEISIDKSYVNFSENKHADVFIEEKGWDNLCKLIKQTQYGKVSTPVIDSTLNEAFKVIVEAYMYSILEKYGYDIDGIQLDFIANTGLNVKFYKDKTQSWKRYPGPWQDWGLED